MKTLHVFVVIKWHNEIIDRLLENCIKKKKKKKSGLQCLSAELDNVQS